MSKQNHSIVIDLMPYDVEISQNVVSIKDCQGSVLGKLDNSTEKTGNRFSEDKSSSYFINDKDRAIFLDFHFDNENVNIALTPKRSEDEMLETVVGWISDNFDGIEDIGYEVLVSENNAILAIKIGGYKLEDELKSAGHVRERGSKGMEHENVFIAPDFSTPNKDGEIAEEGRNTDYASATREENARKRKLNEDSKENIAPKK